MRLKLQLFMAFILVGTLSVGSAASPAIGVVKARGNFRIDNATVYGNSTLFEGTAIETERVPSELEFDSGSRLLLASGSRGTVYRDRTVLERGAAQLSGAMDYPIEARSLRIVAAGLGCTVQVAVNQANHVRVAAWDGPAQVTNAQGTVVANLAPGTALDLNPQAAAAPSQLSGCVQRKGGALILTDETTSVTVELQGAGLDKQVGNVVEVTGAMIPGAKPAAGATQVIRVSDLQATGRKCGSTAGAPAAAAASTAAKVGLSVAAKAAIIGGVAAAASTAGLAASGTFSGEKAPVSP